MWEITNKKVLITGATSGIGRVTSLTLASLGADVTVACRDMNKGKLLLEEFNAISSQKKGRINLLKCDLSSFKSIKSACSEFKKNNKVLDILINNAGIWNFKKKVSQDNIEETFAVNFLAPYFITNEMIEIMNHGDEARILFTASGLHQGYINFDDIEFKNSYSGFKAYRQSKLGIILLARHMANDLKNTNICVFSIHPGMVNSSLGRDAGFFSGLVFKMMGLPVEKGAETLIFIATGDNLSNYSGEYFYLKKVKKTTVESYNMESANKLISIADKYLGGLKND